MTRFIATVLLTSALSITACATTKSTEPPQAIAMTSQSLLKANLPFARRYDEIEIEPQQVALLQSVKTPIKIVALFGTWCHDSEREVPHLIKLLQAVNNPNIAVELLSVDRNKQADEKFKLKFTPTFIIFNQDDLEIGRIVERPKLTLAQDIINIVNR